jgi:energy-coupling factor transporter ATP-binding protein EcfA2
MLTRVYIDNFRSFVNFEYKPERNQLLFGANGSGKSSLLEAIRFIKQFIKGGESPFTPSTRTRWQNKPLQIIEVEALLDGKKYEYRLEMRFAQGRREISVNSEILKVGGALVFELSTEEIHFFQNDSLNPSTLKWETSESALHLSQFSNQSVRRFVEWIESVHCFRIDCYPGTNCVPSFRTALPRWLRIG